MKSTDTIYYCGQGNIYRCPECNKVDRGSLKRGSDIMTCRFCRKEIKLISQSQMNEGLYSVIREINRLETGTIYGASPDMLKDSYLAKAGAAVGLDVVGTLLDSKTEVKRVKKVKKMVPKSKRSLREMVDQLGSPRTNGDYFAPWRATPDQMKEMYETEEGRALLTQVGRMLCRKKSAKQLTEGDHDDTVPTEIFEEARMKMLIKANPNLDQKQKMAFLKKEGYKPDVNDEGRVYVYFGSTVAPECDVWVYWD